MELYDEEYDENEIYDIVDDKIEEEYQEESDEEIYEETEKDTKTFTKEFINSELSIFIENAKTHVKFIYNKKTYKGIIMKEFPSGNDDYIFLVECLDEDSVQKGKFMKKIHVPDAIIIK